MRIVVIEDEDNTRYGIMNLINKLGAPYEVVGDADNGEQGLVLIEQLRPDLVITDIKMPQVSGIEMLEALKRKGHRHQTVILTGFSQYEYAKKALGLGVLEFLEKPITAMDLKETLEKATEEQKLQQMAGIPHGHAAERLEHYLQQSLSQQQAPDLSLLAPLAEQAAGFKVDEPFGICTIYVGDAYDRTAARLKSGIEQKLNAATHSDKHCVFAVAQDRSLIILSQPSAPDTLAAFIRSIVPNAAITVSRIRGLHELYEAFASQQSIRKWTITMNENAVILSDSVIGNFAAEALSFPHNLDHKIRAAIQERKADDIHRSVQEWLLFCYAGHYHPQHIIDSCIRLLSSILRVIGETYGDETVFHYQKEWLQPVLTAQTRSELKASIERVATDISALGQASDTPAYSLIVQKAVRIIHERYREGVTLDEIATMLHITPEYLSTLFAKEVKSNFSAYIKNIRVSQAKHLMLTTDRKMFEIAKSVGYPDPKYFSRVFKEMTGLSPAEYQKIHNGDS
ncbi:response regulator transcription factor [Paenibacillus sp. YIM B09110]|uniref:response regulator transcription factor n=1 Tax=Paenibacillus sp. YIM B09110 TaxID=3126102 RepID=UPI00301CA873